MDNPMKEKRIRLEKYVQTMPWEVKRSMHILVAHFALQNALNEPWE